MVILSRVPLGLSQVLLGLSQALLCQSQALLGQSRMLLGLFQVLLGPSQVLLGPSQAHFRLSQELLGLFRVPLSLIIPRNYPPQISHLHHRQKLLDHLTAKHPPWMWVHASPCLMKVVSISLQRGCESRMLPCSLLSATPFS